MKHIPLSLLMASMALPAYAGFTLNSPEPPSVSAAAPAPQSSSAIPAATTVGARTPITRSGAGSDSRVANGFGNAVPIETAAEMIVPPDRAVIFDDGVNRSQSVSWRGGKPWKEVMDDTLAPLGLVATNDGIVTRIWRRSSQASSIQIAFAPQPLQPPSSTNAAPAPTPASQPHAAPVASGAQVASSPAAASPPPPPFASPAPSPAAGSQPSVGGAPSDDCAGGERWDAKAGSTLRTELNTWGRRAGWTVTFQTDRDYPLQASASFEGNFVCATGKLLRAFRAAKPTPTAVIYRGNKSVYVSADEEETE
jgi:hypothetical protein